MKKTKKLIDCRIGTNFLDAKSSTHRAKRTRPFFNVLAVVLLLTSAGCTTIYRAEISSEKGNPVLADSVRSSEFFIFNGFEKKPWPHNLAFGSAKRRAVSQTVLAYWSKGPDETVIGRKSGMVQAWEVLEGRTYVIYIVGNRRDEQADSTVNNLKTSLSKMFPSINITISEDNFIDLR